MLPEHLPISDAYTSTCGPNVWYSSQRQHLQSWFSELSGAGAYGRSSRGLTAKHGYNHLQCAQGLLWLAEALGEDSDRVRQAAQSAGGTGREATQCAAVRRVIPWSRIWELTSPLIEEERRARRRGKTASTQRRTPPVRHQRKSS